MKKYVIPIASDDIDLKSIKFKEPLQCVINNKINITYKKYIDPNTHETIKNKFGINFNGEIVKKEDTINLVGNFCYSKKLRNLWFISIILIELFICYITLSDFMKTWFLDISILISLIFYNNLVNRDNEKFIIINLLTKETNKISSKNFDYTYLYNEKYNYYDLDEFYKDVYVSSKVEKRNKYVKNICCLLGVVLFFSGVIGTFGFKIGSTAKKFEIVNDYSPLYEKEDFAVDENNRLYVVCTNYTEVFDENGKFLMKVNHGKGVSDVYLNFKDGLTGFLVSIKGEDDYHEFIVDVSNEKILKENTYKEEEIDIENFNGSRYYERHDKLYTIRGDKVSIVGKNVDKVVDLNSPKTPIYFGYLLTLSFIGVAMLYFVNLKFN